MIDIKKLIEQEYTNVYDYKDFLVEYFASLKADYGIEISKSIFAFSSCSDELNRNIDSIDFLGNSFFLGGIAGYPHCGLTGIIAYSSHLIKEGTAVILYGPHIGITKQGELGKILRIGQNELSNCCGSLCLALSHFQNDKNYLPNVSNLEDIQQMLLEQQLAPFKQKFLKASNPIKEITNITYDIIEKQVEKLIASCKHNFNVKYIVTIGGIIVNTSVNFNDYIVIKKKKFIEL